MGKPDPRTTEDIWGNPDTWASGYQHQVRTDKLGKVWVWTDQFSWEEVDPETLSTISLPMISLPAIRPGERIEIGTFGKQFTWSIGVAPKGLRCGFTKTAQGAAEAATRAILELRANGR